MHRSSIVLSLAVIAASSAWAAEPAPPAAPRVGRAPRVEQAPRDPFQPLHGGSDSDPRKGLPGMRLGDLRLTGVMATPQGDVAIFQHATGAFFAKAGDRMKDALVDAVLVKERSVVVVVPDTGVLGEKLVQLELP